MVSHDALDHIHSLYINNNHPVFNIVPPRLNSLIDSCYAELGRPVVECTSIWTIYCSVLDLICVHDGVQDILEDMEGDVPGDTDLSLIPDLQDLPERDSYMEGVRNGLGLCK